jgi:predicted phosphoribosyltransferase
VEPYPDRRAAGRELAAHLGHHRDAVVVGITVGGLVVADELAAAIGGRLALAPVRRLGAPESPSLVVGAVSVDGELLVDGDLMRRLGLRSEDLTDQAVRARVAIRAELDALGAEPPELADRDVIVVPEGATAGIALRAALAYVRRGGARRATAAIPVAPPATVDLIASEADEVVCPRQPLRLGAIEDWYRTHPTVERETARRILGRR